MGIYLNELLEVYGKSKNKVIGIPENLLKSIMEKCVKQTSARGWCSGKTQRDRVEREVGGGIGMENTCKSMADSCQCMTKTTTIL